MNMSSSIRVNKSGIVCLAVLGAVIVFVYRSNNGSTSSNDLDTGNELISLKELLSAAVDAAQRGGHEVRHVREAATLNMQSKGKTKEGVNDPVTDGDLKSHIVMYYSLQKAFPGLEIISEEHGGADSSGIAAASVLDPDIEVLVDSDMLVYVKDVRVWIDPLDATKEYTEDLRQYVTTMVGVAVKGEPVLGVVHRPFTNVTHWGWLKAGLSPDLKALKQHPPGAAAPSTSPRIIVSISHQGDVKEVATKAFGASTEIIPAAGAGYKILEVIQGNADAYVHSSLIKKWDLCAGHAILRAMGGTLTTLSGANITYGDRGDYVLDGGLLATVGATSHPLYLSKLQELSKPKKKADQPKKKADQPKT